MATKAEVERGVDAGTKLLNREPSRKPGANPKAKPADAVDAGSTTNAKAKIDNVERGIDAGTKLLKSEPSRKAGAERKDKAPAPAQHVIYPGTEGRKVWAYRAGNFSTGKTSEWDHSFSFSKLNDILETMKKKEFEGQVANLSLVAHGDANGLVQLDSPLTPKTIGAFSGPLSGLRSYLKPNGKLIFMSCIAGKGEEGTALLAALSTILSGIYVIGFTIFGGFSGALASAPGQIWEDQYGNSRGMALPATPKWLTEHSIYSKWALNGKIIRFPQDEQALRPNKKCANPSCPGHLKGIDQCDSFP